MAIPKIEEPTLYPPIIEYLKEIGIVAIGNTSVQTKEPDILFKIDSENFVVEVKIGLQKIPKAVAQGYDYANRLGTRNVVILFYPESLSGQTILDFSRLYVIAKQTKITALVMTEYWTESIEGTIENIFPVLKNRFALKKRHIDFNSVVKLIEENVKELHSLIKEIKGEKLFEEVVKSLDLFASIGEIKDRKTAISQVNSLGSYLLFNQLLFYHIYKKKTDNPHLDELDIISKVEDIQKYFDAITDIDYRSIYEVNILGHIPNKPEVIDTLNEIIKSIKLLRVEHITHDLAGRFFHDLIPHEVRKVLAAFYTHPIAAKILAGLTINSWDETVMDPACGSGTLLVSAYHRKQELYKKIHGYKEMKELHRKFVEKDITGIDIMPFAAHLSTLNLTTQNIEKETNIVRIATKDSLSLAGKNFNNPLKNKDFVLGEGLEIQSFSKYIQRNILSQTVSSRGEGAMSPEGKGAKFFLKPVDVIIMNPPFSDREKMPEDMRNKINSYHSLDEICGKQVNLWGYFLALSHYLLKPNGKMGVVIPINIARGRATEKIREFILKNYHIIYIVKPIADVAFSESSDFKDVLLIAEKKKPEQNDLTCIVLLKKSKFNMSNEETDTLIEDITSIKPKEGLEISKKDFDIFYLKNEKLLHHKENLMPILGFSDSENKKALEDFLVKIRERAGNKLMKIKRESVAEGFHASPAGLSELLFVTNPFDDSRVKRAFMILKKINKDTIEVGVKDTDFVFIIPKSKTSPAIRTLTGVKSFCMEKEDYIINQRIKDFDKLLNMSKWRSGELNWSEIGKNIENKSSYIVVGRRFRPNSNNTHNFAFYSKDKILSPHTFKVIKFKDYREAMLQVLILNSIITIVNIISLKEQTTGGFTDIMESDLALFDIFDISKIDKKTTSRLYSTFEKLAKVEFPSIISQFTTNCVVRRELDVAVLEALGFGEYESEKFLDKVYKAISNELGIKE